MRRITGTHVYSYVKCPHLAALDLHLPRSARRPPAEWEEFAARRGRDFEAAFVHGLPAIAPAYPERDFAAGAAATLELLRAGAEWIHQGVLAADDQLGLPDLLHVVPGPSDLGDHHYEVVDVKTSGRPRGDQILQVVFYSQLLGKIQGRQPAHGALVLKDGRTERFLIDDYAAAAAQVVDGLRRLREDPAASRPMLRAACAGCHHDQRCLPELAASGDLSLVHGMSPGARAILESLGCRTVEALATFRPDGARQRGHLDATLLRRLRRAAQAHLLGHPVLEERPRHEQLAPAAIVHALFDPFADRVLAFGMLHPASEDGEVTLQLPRAVDDEWQALQRLVAPLPDRTWLLHFGEALRRWHEEQVFAREFEPVLEARLVDLLPRLSAAAIYPRPVFSLADFVAHGLGRDPWRAGHPGAAALWAAAPDGAARLAAKLRTDLLDLAALKARILDARPAAARPESPGTAGAADPRAANFTALDGSA